MHRRALLRQAATIGLAAAIPRSASRLLAAPAARSWPSVAGQYGVTVGTFTRHLSPTPAAGKLVLLDLPAVMRDELDLKVLDLMTACLPSLEPEYCERLRAAADRAGRTVTNLKMNQLGLDLASPDAALREHSLAEYRRTIDAAERLGCRWVRPATTPHRQDLDRLAAGLRELIAYAAPKGITLLVENNGWMRSEPDAIPRIIAAVGPGLAAQPDSGNWTDEARYAGLARSLPHAATYDFKALELGPDGQHAAYDLRRCFDLAWQAGFRGPWCFEHFHAGLAPLYRELILLRRMLECWTAEAS